MTPALKLRAQAAAATAAEQVVARFDSLTPDQHVDGINQARERARIGRAVRKDRARAASARLRNAS
jgi:hypothetical protein